MKKPVEASYRAALDALGVRAEAAMMIGDSLANDSTQLDCNFYCNCKRDRHNDTQPDSQHHPNGYSHSHFNFYSHTNCNPE